MVFIYAKEILKTCYQINKSRCLGCQYLVANQLYHECFTNTLHEILEFYFEEALNGIEHEKIVELWKSYVSKFHIPNKSCVNFIDTYYRDWWKEKSGYWTRAIKRFALFDVLKSLYSDAKILSKYIPSAETNISDAVKMHKDKEVKDIFLSMCDVKIYLTFTSPNMVLL